MLEKQLQDPQCGPCNTERQRLNAIATYRQIFPEVIHGTNNCLINFSMNSTDGPK